MTGALDPKRDLSFLAAPPKSQVNNTGAFIGNLTSFLGHVGVLVNLGTKTAGDSDGVITISVLASATNNISNATNNGVSGTVATSNNATSSGTISVDTRGVDGPFLFYVPVLTGTNSPAYPLAVAAVGTKQVQ